MRVDLNCDIGESYGRYQLGNDGELLKLVTSANIACGFHAGDPLVMAQTVQLAVENKVAIGAHPAYPDLQGFGRRVMDLIPEEVEAMVLYQIGALSAFAQASGSEITHVKPHGALYNQAVKDEQLATAIARGTARFSRSLVLVGLAGSWLVTAAQDVGLQVAQEGFPERGYQPDGTLRPRNLPGALIHEPQQAADQALKLVQEGIQVNANGRSGHFPVDTLCIHGDSPQAVSIAHTVKNALVFAGIQVCAMKQVNNPTPN